MEKYIKLGDSDISAKAGAADCSIYLGTDKVYQQGETQRQQEN